MRVSVRVMDVWRLDSSRVLVVRESGLGNGFCRVSLGTGEQSRPQTGEELFGHLVLGRNRLGAAYEYETNLAREYEARFPGFGPFAPLVAWAGEKEES